MTSKGWLTLLAATGAAATGSGMFSYTSSYFVKPLELANGWTRSEIALGATLGFIATAMASPIAGALTDRYGARRVGVTGLILYGGFCLVLAGMPASLPMFYALMVCIAVSFSCTTAVVFAPLVVAKFRHSRGMGLGVLMSGTGLLLIPLSPVFVHLNTEVSWRAGYALIGAMALLIGIPSVLIAARNSMVGKVTAPAEAGMTLRNAMRTLDYWKLMGGVLVGTIPLGGFLNQMSPLFLDKGLSITEVGALGSLFMMMVIVGRTGVGVLLDTLKPSLVGLAIMLVAACGALALLQPEPSFMVCALSVMLVGCAIGAEGDIQAFFSARQFGLKSFSTIFGTYAMATSVGYGLGASIFGRLHDWEGGYHTALIFAAAAFGIAGVLLGSLGAKPPVAAEIPDDLAQDAIPATSL